MSDSEPLDDEMAVADDRPVGDKSADSGIRRSDAEGQPLLDALAGRSCLMGFGCRPIIEAVRSAADRYLGDAAALRDQPAGGDDQLLQQFQEVLRDSDAVAAESIFVSSSADMAAEVSIDLARTWKSDTAYRTITLVGSDHGRTGTCRTASGRPCLHDGYGPMMAGFTHVPAGDIDAMRGSVDQQTACILLSPIDLADSCRQLTAEYLAEVRTLCDDHDLALIFDESRIAFGSSGKPFAFSAIADICADAVILSAGLFAGLPGGIVLASEKLTNQPVIDTAVYPMQLSVASATLDAMTAGGLPESADEAMRQFAVALAEAVGGFEFVRDVHVLGTTIGIETDIGSEEVVAAARVHAVRLEAAGETAVRLQLPLTITDDDRSELLSRLGQLMQRVERQAAEMSA